MHHNPALLQCCSWLHATAHICEKGCSARCAVWACKCFRCLQRDLGWGLQVLNICSNHVDVLFAVGGVSADVLNEQRERQKQRERAGLYASTSGREKQPQDSHTGNGSSMHSSRDRYSHHSSSSSRDRGRHRDRPHESSRESDRHRDSSRQERSSRDFEGQRSGDDRRSNGAHRQSDYDRSKHSERRGERPSSSRSEPRSHGRSSRSDWETATPLRRPDEDEWDMTPARPGTGSRQAGVAASPWESDTPRRGGKSTPSVWDSSATPALPAVAKPGGKSGIPTGESNTGGRVKFDVEHSPALTPSWKSTSWSKAAAKRDTEGAASPELRPDDAHEFDETMRCASRLAATAWCCSP